MKSLEGLYPGVNKSIGSSLSLPSTFPSVYPSSYTHKYQGSSEREGGREEGRKEGRKEGKKEGREKKERGKEGKEKERKKSPRAADHLPQEPGWVRWIRLPFCIGDTWKGICELITCVVDVRFLSCKNIAKVKLYFLLLISNLDPPFQLSNRKSDLV